MRTKLLLTTVIVVLIGVLAFANRSTLSVPTAINLLLGEVHASLGLIMLTALAVVMVAYLSLVTATERAAMIAQTRMRLEMDRLRQIADQNEASRVADLRGDVDRQFASLHEKLDRIASRHQAVSSAEHPVTSLPDAIGEPS